MRLKLDRVKPDSQYIIIWRFPDWSHWWDLLIEAPQMIDRPVIISK